MEDQTASGVSTESEMEKSENVPVAKSLKCEECNKLFRSSEEVEFHAAKTGHSNFSESTEEKKPLTEEEKKEQLKKVEELMRQKRKDREEKEKAEQLEQEKRRIQSGKELASIRKKLEDEAIKKLAEERRREKEEERKARQRVKDMIAQDKLDRKKNSAASTVAAVTATTVPSQPQTVPSAPKEYTETRIQIRLTNGSTLTHTFGTKEQLASIRLFIEMNRTDVDPAGNNRFKLQTNFPRHVFTEEEYEKPLDSLGLVPSAVLIVSRV